MVWGKQMPAADSTAEGGLPLGLASGIRLKNDIAKGSRLSWSDVEIDENDTTVKFRREMEAAFALPNN
jgi:predicted homoserine dehydrogenase-like protein